MKSLYQFILERTAIDFKAGNPNYGQAVILGGGAGSGKGFTKSRILGNFKSYDVDELKKEYIRLAKAGKIDGDNGEYDLNNPADVSALHMKVKDRGWKNSQRDMMLTSQKSRGKDRLDNIIFDQTCDDIKDLEKLCPMLKSMGYNVSVVWVVCNTDSAKEGNAARARKVDEKDVLEKTHKGAYNTMMSFLTNKHSELNEYVDSFWIGLSAGFGREMSAPYKNDTAIKVKKDDNGNWVFDKARIDKFLNEQQPLNYGSIAKFKKKCERGVDDATMRDWKMWKDKCRDFDPKKLENVSGTVKEAEAFIDIDAIIYESCLIG